MRPFQPPFSKINLPRYCPLVAHVCDQVLTIVSEEPLSAADARVNRTRRLLTNVSNAARLKRGDVSKVFRCAAPTQPLDSWVVNRVTLHSTPMNVTSRFMLRLRRTARTQMPPRHRSLNDSHLLWSDIYIYIYIYNLHEARKRGWRPPFNVMRANHRRGCKGQLNGVMDVLVEEAGVT